MTNRYTGLSGDALLDEEIRECYEIIGNPECEDIKNDVMRMLNTLLWLKQQRKERAA